MAGALKELQSYKRRQGAANKNTKVSAGSKVQDIYNVYDLLLEIKSVKCNCKFYT